MNLLELSLETFLVISSEFTYVLQWNLSNPDINGAEGSVIVSEVSSFQRLKCMQEWYLWWEKVSRGGVLIEGCKIQSNHRIYLRNCGLPHSRVIRATDSRYIYTCCKYSFCKYIHREIIII